jgi:hypothetical protein
VDDLYADEHGGAWRAVFLRQRQQREILTGWTMSGFAEDGFRMASVRASDEAKRRAFGHVIGSVNSAESFPAQVFQRSWGAFLFFESDRLFASGFAVIAAGLLNAERPEVCCLLNFSETDRVAYESAAMLFIDAGTEPHAYDAMLRQGGPARGWLFGMDRYGSASDRGNGAFTARRGMTSRHCSASTVFGLLRAAEWNPAKRIQAEEVFREVPPGRRIEDKLPIGI